MRLARFQKTPVECIRYTIDYTDWLDISEFLSEVVLTPDDPALVVEGSLIATDGLSVTYYVSGGSTGRTYTLHVRATTTVNQVKEDYVIYFVSAIQDAA